MLFAVSVGASLNRCNPYWGSQSQRSSACSEDAGLTCSKGEAKQHQVTENERQLTERLKTDRSWSHNRNSEWNLFLKNRQGCLVAEGGWHLRRLPDGHPTKLGECSTRPGYLQIALRHSAKHRLRIASEVHVSTLQLVGVDSLQFWNGTDVKSLKYQ